MGFMSIEDDCLRWRGAWFQFRLRREDVAAVDAEAGSAQYLVRLAPDRLGELYVISFHALPSVRPEFSLTAHQHLRDWHAAADT
jgi:hypothetical protein